MIHLCLHIIISQSMSMPTHRTNQHVFLAHGDTLGSHMYPMRKRRPSVCRTFSLLHCLYYHGHRWHWPAGMIRKEFLMQLLVLLWMTCCAWLLISIDVFFPVFFSSWFCCSDDVYIHVRFLSDDEGLKSIKIIDILLGSSYQRDSTLLATAHAQLEVCGWVDTTLELAKHKNGT